MRLFSMELGDRWQKYSSEPGTAPSSVKHFKVGTGALSTGRPIDRWLELLYVQDAGDSLEGLRAIYRDHFPTQGELIFTGACEFACQHCIYPPDYVKHNSSLLPSAWKGLLRTLNGELGINTFVYGGRSVTRHGVEVLAVLRDLLPEARIGLIDNGISMLPYRDELAAMQLDWIDISIDGMEEDHDKQRGQKGSFAKALQTALWLKDHRVAPKINILTCLTTINRDSVVEMIRFLNRQGFKNVFITPVNVLDGYRPSADLMVTGQSFTALIEGITASMDTLDDAWIEILLFEVEYVKCIGEHRPQLWESLQPEEDRLTWKVARNGNDFSINYYPLSLTGIREFIVNSNGDVIPPKVMAKGRIPPTEVIGNLLQEGPLSIVTRLPVSSQFRLYHDQLLKEQQCIRSMKWASPTRVQ